MKMRGLGRRILALLMVLAMTVGVVPFAAFAEGETTLSFNIGTYVVAGNRPFSGQPVDLLTVDTGNLPEGVVLYYTCNGVTTTTIPQQTAIGEYTVTVNAYMNSTILATQTFQAVIHGNGISATPLKQMYDGFEHPMVTITGTQVGDVIEYRVDGVWSTECPTLTDVGMKGGIAVQVTRNGGLVFAQENIIAEISMNNMLQLAYKQDSLSNYGVLEYPAGDTTIDLGAKYAYDNHPGDLSIIYGCSAIITASRDNGTTDRGMTVNAETGVITLQKGDVPTEAGLYEVYARIKEPAGKNNYTEAAKTLSQFIVVYDTPELTFSEEQLNYILGTTTGEGDQAKVNADVPGLTVSEQETDAAVIPNNSIPVYSIACETEGSAYANSVSIDPVTGKFTVDPTMLGYIGSPEKGCIETYTVTATMEGSTYDFGTRASEFTGMVVEVGERTVYSSATEASYKVNILQSDVNGEDVTNAYQIQEEAQNGWYGGNGASVTAKAVNGYRLAKDGDAAYADDLTFTEEGDEHYLFIQNDEKGIVSGMLRLLDPQGNPVKIDSTEPNDFNIVYKKVSLLDIIQEVLSLGFKKSGITVTVSASDAASGIEGIRLWAPQNGKDVLVTAGGTSSVLPSDSSAPLEIRNNGEDKSTFSTTFLITASDVSGDLANTSLLDGQAIDLAGNVKSGFDSQVVYTNASNFFGNGDLTVITDGNAPVITLDSMTAYNEDDEVITEPVGEVSTDQVKVSRFAPAVSKVDYCFSILDDTLSHAETLVTVNDQMQKVIWTDIPGGKQGKLQLAGDGEYLIEVAAFDDANNSTEYAHKLVLDTTAPVVEIISNVESTNNIGYTNADIVYTITVEDANFDADRVNVFCAKDGAEFTDGKLSDWTSVEDKHQAIFTIKNTDDNNGTYTLRVNASDGLSDTFSCSTTEEEFADSIVLDTQKPVVTFTYGEGKEGVLRTAQLQVSDEHPADSFPADAFIENSITAKNILGTTVENAVAANTDDWSTSHTVTLLFNKEANYTVNALPEGLIRDRAGNEAVLDPSSKSYEKAFTLDHTAPNAPNGATGTVGVIINIKDANKGTSTPGNWLERVVGKLFGYWNTDITVEIQAEDMVSGLGSASYSFTPVLGATKEGTVQLAQSKDDPKSFSGTFKLPANLVDAEKQQLNGRIHVWLTDKSGNKASMTDEGWHIVYDTINPRMDVHYETSSNEPENGKVIYFAKPITAYVGVMEEHFEPDILTISNNGTAVRDLVWNPVARDGQTWNETSFMIGKSGEETVDGEYTITIKGQDYAGNVITDKDGNIIDYTSKTLIVDGTAPILSNPSVSSGEPKRTTDAVDYYMDENGVHFTFVVEEMNFDAQNILVKVQKNGASAVLNTDYTLTWTTDGIRHTGDVHMTVDGEYSIAISGTDLATNKLVAGENVDITDDLYQYDKKIVLDNTAPELSLTYVPVEGIQAGAVKDNKEYIPGDIVFTLTLSDNFLNAVTDATDCSGVYLRIDKTMNGERSTEQKAITADMWDNDPAANRGSETLYTYTWTEQDDAEYQIEAFYTDFVYRGVEEDGQNYTTNSVPDHVAVIDKTAPELSVVYADGKNQKYYKLDDLKTADNENGYREAVVTIQERNLDTDVVTDNYLLGDDFLQLTDVAGTSIKAANSVQIAKRQNEEVTEHIWDLVFAAEANYVYDLLVKDGNSGKTVIQDLAGNELVLAESIHRVETVFTVDRTSPSAEAPSQEEGESTEAGPGTISVTYNIPKDSEDNDKWYTNLWENIKFGFWKEMIEVTITCYEEIAGIDPGSEFKYIFTKADPVEKDGRKLFVSGSNADTFEGKVKFVQDGKTFSATVKLPVDVIKDENGNGILEENAQLNGTFSISLQDCCSNESKYNGKPDNADGEEIRLIYDTISPTREVTFGPVANARGDKTYFAGDITGTVRVNEANFFIENGRTDIIDTGFDTNWVSESADKHVGTFKVIGEGEHVVTVNGKDYAGNHMEEWKSETLVIDTQIVPPVITVNGEDANGRAFKDDVLLGISFFDTNFMDVELQVLRTRLNEKDEDVTDLLDFTEELDEEGGIISFEPLEIVKDNDGIYVVNVTMTDWANHTSTTTTTFSVNRFGSVYTYGDYLFSIIQDGGLYINEVKEDLEIHEFNADRLVGDVKIKITRDGRPIDEILYTSNALQNDIAIGESGWYEYTHIIKKENFEEDGLYKISVSSEDYAGNYPENTNMEGMSIQFYVDSTPPELTSVTGLEKDIVNAEFVDVKYVAYDTMGLKSVKVYLDGILVEDTTEFPDRNNHSSELRLEESDETRTVAIVLEDLAGNILDTRTEDFESAYVMVDEITVSTSFWVRFLANKPLLYGCIAALAFVAAAVGIGVPTVVAIKKKGRYAKRK